MNYIIVNFKKNIRFLLIMPAEEPSKDVLILEDDDYVLPRLENVVREMNLNPLSAAYSEEFERLLASTNSFYAAILDDLVPKEAHGPRYKEEGTRFARQIKREHPEARVALHTRIFDNFRIESLERAGIVYIEKGKYDEVKRFLTP